MSDLRSAIGAASAQELFDSASNAGAKGHAQYLTPDRFAQFVSLLLTSTRHTILDLTAGDGALLRAARHAKSRLFAVELDPLAAGRITATEGSRLAHVLTGDVTLLAPLLLDAGCEADVIVLNPPWDLHFYRDRLECLASSPVGAVRDAFAAHDGRTAHETIDSTVATLCLGLSLAHGPHGEGLLIANENTLQRLILGPGAPHSALVKHCWAHAVFPGDVFATGEAGDTGLSCPVGVLWWARSHTIGPAEATDYLLPHWPAFRKAGELAKVPGLGAALQTVRLWRSGSEPRSYNDHFVRQLEDWEVAAEEWRHRQAEASGRSRPFHLFLLPDGTIGTKLSGFEGRTIERDKISRLHALGGKTPLQLVIQRTERNLLTQVARNEGWRVDPALLTAIETALAEYHRVRAPLVPLNAVQRMGYLDEEDTIRCLRDLTVTLKPTRSAGVPPAVSPASRRPAASSPLPSVTEITFRAGERYPLRTVTAQVDRKAQKFNVAGELEDVQLSGKHLAIFIGATPSPSGDRGERAGERGGATIHSSSIHSPPAGEAVPEACFMDRALLAEGHTFGHGARVDATLHDLAAHFEIPEVPDIASLQPADYRRHLTALDELEQLLTA